MEVVIIPCEAQYSNTSRSVMLKLWLCLETNTVLFPNDDDDDDDESYEDHRTCCEWWWRWRYVWRSVVLVQDLWMIGWDEIIMEGGCCCCCAHEDDVGMEWWWWWWCSERDDDDDDVVLHKDVTGWLFLFFLDRTMIDNDRNIVFAIVVKGWYYAVCMYVCMYAMMMMMIRCTQTKRNGTSRRVAIDYNLCGKTAQIRPYIYLYMALSI